MKLKWSECVSVILHHGHTDVRSMVSCFDIAARYGGGWRNEAICAAGYVISACRGLISPYSGGFYTVTEKGIEKRPLT